MIELKDFQQQAAEQIADRFAKYYDEPPMRGRRGNLRVVPFYQSLDSITASGKTVMLADAVSTISTLMPIPPIVLWLSKGKVVVDQTYANLAAGGKYHHLLGNARFGYLAKYDQTDVRESTEPLVYFATVGTFNQKDKEKGERLIFKSEIDTAEDSTWEALKLRLDANDRRRPLLLVYDEGHNLTDQQMDLLLELEPDGLIAASATMKLPAQLGAEVKLLREEGWTDEELSDRCRREGSRGHRPGQERDSSRGLRSSHGGDDRFADRRHARGRRRGSSTRRRAHRRRSTSARPTSSRATVCRPTIPSSRSCSGVPRPS